MDRKEERAQYYIANKERILEVNRQWRANNPEYMKQYNANHTKERRQRTVNEREKTTELKRQWVIENKEHHVEYQKQYFKSDKGKIASRRHIHKRRGLGFFPLNDYFEGAEAHHISQNFVVYIPKTIHRSIFHSIWNWYNMNKINKLAIEFI